MKWFAEHKLLSIIGGIVLSLCLIIIISYATAGGSTLIGRGVQKVLTVIEKPMASISGEIGKTFTGIFQFKDLQKENEKLIKENEELKRKNKDLQLSRDELAQLEKLSKTFDYTPYSGNENVVAGRVISLNYSNPYIVFTIDVGEEKGLKVDDVVVDGSGLVGKVQEVGSGWAKVSSILNDSNNISFKVLRKTSIQGVIKERDGEKLKGYIMDENARILKGDTLVTSGIGIYQEGIEIGKVETVDYDADKQLRTITIKPTVKFKSLQKVAVYI